MQLPLIVPTSSWKPPRLSDLPDWQGAKRISIDIETRDEQLRELGPGVRRGSYIVGISFAIEDSNHKYYIPLRHELGDNVEDPVQGIRYFIDQSKRFTGEIVGANLSYDLDFLWAAGIHFPNIKRYCDIQIYEPLIDDLAMSYSLEKISNKYLGVGKDETLLKEAAIAYGVDPKKDLWKLPARYVGDYATADADLPLKILRRQEKEVEEQDLFKIVKLESRLLPVLVKMRQRGVRINLDKLAQIEEWSRKEEQAALDKVKHETGCEIPFGGVWRAELLAKPLTAIGIKVPLTPKTKKPSIDKLFLNSIKHPVADAILRARKVNKIRTTFVQSVRDHVTNGKIHCTITQLRSSQNDDEDSGSGARYGRCASSNPNLQQQPGRDPEIGNLWRSVYIPEEGELWCSADFSSQEPRQAVHYANCVRLGSVRVKNDWLDADSSAQDLAERYRNNPDTDPHSMMGEIIHGRPPSSQERKRAKDIFLGRCYGMGGLKLCKQLGLPTISVVKDLKTGAIYDPNTEEGQFAIKRGHKIMEVAGEEGQNILDQFESRVPWVGVLSRICTKAAMKNGYIRTQAGRKCRFPQDEQGNYDWTYKALNRLIQGSAADQTKQSLVELDKAGANITLVIHDEVCASIKNMEEARLIVNVMENAYKLKVPNKLTLKVGSSWGEAIEV